MKETKEERKEYRHTLSECVAEGATKTNIYTVKINPYT